MTYRRAHGNGADALARVETAPADELPAGLPAPARRAANRDPSGRFVSGPGTARAASEAAKAKAEQVQLARLLGFVEPDDGHRFVRYHRLAVDWRTDQAEAVALTIGGGELSPGVSSIIASAALALAGSRYLYDEAAESGDPKLFAQAARLADQSRQSLLTAHELAAREAVARAEADKRRRAAATAAKRERFQARLAENNE